MSRKEYWWIVCTDSESGKRYLLFGSDKSEDDARQNGLEMLGGTDFEIRMFPTSDRNTASAMLRGKRLKESHSLAESSQRIGHERSIDRLRQKGEISE